MDAELKRKLQAARPVGAAPREPREQTAMQRWPPWAEVQREGEEQQEGDKVPNQDTETAAAGRAWNPIDAAEEQRCRQALVRFQQQLAEQREGEEQQEGDRVPNLGAETTVAGRAWNPIDAAEEQRCHQALVRFQQQLAEQQEGEEQQEGDKAQRQWSPDAYEYCEHPADRELTSDDRVAVEEARWWRRDQEMDRLELKELMADAENRGR